MDGDLTRFLTYVDKKPDGCWWWKGGKDIKEYGIFWYKGKTQFAHRVSLLLHNKVKHLNPKLQVLHSCRSKQCVNPEHLSEGTREQNSADKVRDGTDLRGSKCHFSKLTWEKVSEIRKSTKTVKQLAEEHDVSDSAIRAIIKGKTWIAYSDLSPMASGLGEPSLTTQTI
jgi:hypothetical protein